MLLSALASALVALSPIQDHPYPTPSAAAAALSAMVPHEVSAGEEVAAIWEGPSGAFYACLPVPQRTHDAFAAAVRSPTGYRLVGLFHTHPGRESQIVLMFSPEDVAVAQRLGIASYIRFAATGEVKVYAPGRTRTALREVDGWRVQVSYGDRIEQ